MDHPRVIRVVILRHECRDPVLRLWNRLYIEAFAHHVHAAMHDWSAGEYLPIVRWAHKICVSLFLRAKHSRGLLWWTSAEPFYLPPTASPPAKFGKSFAQESTLYFSGWSFRNPEGIYRYRDQLITSIPISRTIRKKVQKRLAPHRDKILIGLYIRTTPHPYFPNGEFLVSQTRMEAVAAEYLKQANLSDDQVTMVPVNDHQKDVALAEHLFLLSQCSVVLGVNDPFANLAAWLGNIPHIVATNAPIDWEYYRNKDIYFNNKYATGVVGLLPND